MHYKTSYIKKQNIDEYIYNKFINNNEHAKKKKQIT
jgi:hypothetical protein